MLRILLLISGLRAVQSASCALGSDVIKLRSWSGGFQSPGWAENLYPNDQQCQWDIQVSQGSRVNLTFKSFSLEEGVYRNSPPTSTKICRDVVKIADDTNVLFSGCGTDGDGMSFLSSGNNMTIIFHADESLNEQGFEAFYEGVCERNITSNMVLESPGFPDSPPDNVTCQWTVESNQSALILIRPPEDELQRFPECNNSSIKWESSSLAPDSPLQTKALCRTDSVALSLNNVVLTYEPKASDLAWIGRLEIKYTNSGDCKDFCTQNIQECLSPRVVAYDYRCICKCGYHGVNCEVYEDPCVVKNCSGSCTVVGTGSDFDCLCDDPCANVTCLNGGTCLVDAVKGTHCQCPDGYLPPDCHPGPCVPSPCLHGTCMDDGRGSFVCTCSPEYTGLLCSILTDAPRCMAEVDVTVGSGIQWSDTLAGQYDTQPCPGNTEGSATRNCIEDDLSPTRGLWRRPDLSRCVSPALVRLLSNAGSRAGIQEDLLYNLTRDLDHATSVVKNKSGPSLFPGDLLAASDLLRQISGGVIKAKSIDHDPAGMVKHFLSTVDNILNPAALDVWKNALVHLVEVKVTSIIASSQQFTENLILRHPSMLNISQPGAGTGSPEVASAVFSASSDNVDLRVMEWWDLTSDVSLSLEFPRHADLQGAQLTLPPDVITITHGDGSDRPLRLYSARFTSVAPLFSLKENRYKKEDNTNITKIVTSDVISVEVLGVPKSAFSKFSRPVKITFRVTNSSKIPDLKKFCVFMNMTARSADERWLDDGCNVDDANETHVTCFCYHLTNFAVLLDVYDNADKLDEGNSAALSYISYIGGSLSILSCVVVIAVFEYFRLRSDRIRIHEQLAVSIIAVQVFFLIGVGRTAADDDSAMWACKTVAILLHFSLTALFCWMLVEGLHLYVLLVKVFKRGSHIKKYCAIGWGAPTLIVAVSVGVFFDKYGEGEICWLNHEPLLVCFVPTVSLVITVNSVILVLVLRVMFKSVNSAAKANTEQQSSVSERARNCPTPLVCSRDASGVVTQADIEPLKKREALGKEDGGQCLVANMCITMSLKASAVLLPLLGLTWILGFLAVDTGHSKVMMYIFNYLFTITNSFQGVMFFVFHCLLNVDVHNAYERRYRQRKKAVSYLETTTRKNSDASTYLADTSPSVKALSKAILSDMSTIHRRPSTAHNRFFLLNRPQAPDDLTRMTFQPVFALAAKSGELAASEANSSNDQQTLENDRVWGGQNDGPSARNGQPIAVLPAATSFTRFPHQPEVVSPGNVVHGIPENNGRVRFS